MAYEQIQNSLLREQEKRRMLQREMLKGSAYNPNAQVSGRSIPYNPIQGLTELGKAWLQKRAMDASDERTEALKAEETAGREGAYGQVTDMYFGKEEDLDAASMTSPEREGAQEKNPIKAAMFAAQDPYLKDTDISNKIMPTKDRGAYSRYVDYTDPKTGITRQVSFNTRAPAGMQLTELDGTPINTRGLSTKDAGIQGLAAGSKEKAKQDVILDMKPQITKATDLASREAEKVIDKPKIDSTMSAHDTKTGMLGGLIEKAKGQSSSWSTGFMASATKWVPFSPAGKLSATLETIKSNIGFDKLQEMRDNSPTGGALGQVSEFENKLLQAVWGNLETSVGQEQFEENLVLVQKQVDESWKRVKAAYKQDYGVEYGSGKNPIKAESGSKAYDDDEKEKRYQEWKAKQ